MTLITHPTNELEGNACETLDTEGLAKLLACGPLALTNLRFGYFAGPSLA